MGSTATNLPPDFSREEFDKFLHAYTHAIRNRLNGIALEAADLAEQGGTDSMRLQQQIQQCSALLKAVREMLSPDDATQARTPLTVVTKQLREPAA